MTRAVLAFLNAPCAPRGRSPARHHFRVCQKRDKTHPDAWWCMNRPKC